MAEEKKNLLTRAGLKQYEDELKDLKDVKRAEVSQKIAVAREQGDLSENAEYDAARDEQRDIEARIAYLENLLKNAEVVDIEETNTGRINFGYTVKVLDKEYKEELDFTIVGASEADCLEGKISNESPLGKALIGCKKGENITIEAPAGLMKYKVIDFSAPVAED